MIQTRDGARLDTKTLPRDDVLEQVRRQEFERDFTIEPLIARLDDDSHASAEGIFH